MLFKIVWFLAKFASYLRRSLFLSTKNLSLSSEGKRVDYFNSEDSKANDGNLYRGENWINGEKEFYFFPNKQIKLMSEGILDLESNVLYDSKKKLVPDYSFWTPEYLKLNRLPEADLLLRLAPKSRVSGPKIHFPSLSFYHFLLEGLPSFIWLQETFPNSPIIARDVMPTYAEDVVALLNLDIQRESSPLLAVEELLYVKQYGTTGWPNPADTSILRDIFYVEKAEKPNRKTYVSRTRSRRSPRFESELEEILLNLGWEVTHLEKYNFLEQIEIVARSKFLMGAHGAGLANAVWLNEKSYLIEIRPTDRPACFSRLANVQNLNFRHFELPPASYYGAPGVPAELRSFLEHLE